MDQYEVDEILNMAIMSKTPYFIVEGVDDICIYEEIAKSANVNCEVYSVDMISGLTGGNDGVVKAMNILNQLIMAGGKKIEHYVLGIVDRDVRFYRNEMPTLTSIFTLNFYSVESHFVSKSVIRPSIDKVTRISVRDDVDIESIFRKIEQELQSTYYFSLEALKKAVDPAYQAKITFSSNVGRRKDPQTITYLDTVKSDLDVLAGTFSIVPDIESMRTFVKGKWLLTAFSEALFKEIEGLVVACKHSLIMQCRICRLNNNYPCLYQLKDGLNKNSLNSLLKDFIDLPELDYIRDAMIKVNTSATI